MPASLMVMLKTSFKHIYLLLWRLFIAMLLFSIGRLVFLYLNYAFYSNLKFLEILHLLIIGFRFDISAIVYLNIPVILMHILPLGQIRDHKIYQGVIKYYFLIVNSLLLLINLVDARFFDFSLKRSTAYMLHYLADSKDVPILIPQFIVDYWYIPVMWIVFTLLAWWLYSLVNLRGKNYNKQKLFGFKRFAIEFVIFTLFIPILLIAARGGMQGRPLSVVDAAKYSSGKSAPLVLNTPFAVMTTLGHQSMKVSRYFSNEECQKIYPTLHQYNYPDSPFRKVNVVILLLESFSREYSGYLNNYKGYMPFLDSLMQQSLLFKNAYANGTRSIDAIPCIVSGIPALMDDPFVMSVFNTNKINSLPEMLKQEGYQTAFFHGGNNGTMNFDSYSKMTGFDAYYGRNEYNNDNDYDGYWGIYDEPFLQFFARKLNTFREPFFAMDFTISSHNPYRVPDKYQEKFPENRVDLLRVVRYSDYALKQFFLTASKMPWFNNTLFIISADHTGHAISHTENQDAENEDEKLSPYLVDFYKNTVGKYAIPILFYYPGDSLVGINESTIQQNDLMPSILDFLKYNKPFVAFGQSVFDKNARRVAVQFVNENYQVIKGDYNLLFDGKKAVSLYHFRNDPIEKNNLVKKDTTRVDELETIIKAIAQQFRHRLINNQLYPE